MSGRTVKHRKILIVDEDQNFAAAIKKVFAGRYAVTCAHNVKEGWEKLRQQRPDLIILDALMDSTGENLLFSRQLRSDKDFRDTPVMILTEMKHQAGLSLFPDTEHGHGFLPRALFMDRPQIPSQLLMPVKAMLRANTPLKESAPLKQTQKPRLHPIILCVDPDRAKTPEYCRIFAKEGYEVETAPTLKDAVSRMRQVRFDCIVLDVDLPDVAGYDAVAIIKTIDPGAKIVVTVGKNTKELEARVRKEDIFYYYIKSFGVEELKLAVRSAVATAHKKA